MIASGKCPMCGRKHSENTLYCSSCLDNHKEKYNAKDRPNSIKCIICEQEFMIGRKGRIPIYCPECKEQIRTAQGNKWTMNNSTSQRDYHREYRKTWRSNHHDAYLDTSLRKKYGITLEQYTAMYVLQDGRCSICLSELPPLSTKGKDRNLIHLDHNHKTNKVRGLLCPQCNYLLGNCKDDISILEKAIKYLKTHSSL